MPRAAVEPIRPNLFIVGAPKCGTTAWHAYLKTHPDIFFSDVKEPGYFGTDLPGMRFVASRNEYERLFARAGAARMVGEASATYLYSAAAAQAIAAYSPEARVLIFLREREDFLPSLHHQLLYRFVESITDFETAWRLSGNRPADTIPRTCREPRLLDYRAFGRFGEQVERYLRVFPAEQVRVFRFEQWTADSRRTYLEILDFLGLDDDGRTDFPPVNEARGYKYKWLGRLIARPPRIAQVAVNLVKTLTGREALGLGAKASHLIAASASKTRLGPGLRDEIRHYYRDDERLLRSLLDTHQGGAGVTKVPAGLGSE